MSLSFHFKKRKSVADFLSENLPDLFHPIYIAATSMSTLILDTSSFGYPIVSTST